MERNTHTYIQINAFAYIIDEEINKLWLCDSSEEQQNICKKFNNTNKKEQLNDDETSEEIKEILNKNTKNDYKTKLRYREKKTNSEKEIVRKSKFLLAWAIKKLN